MALPSTVTIGWTIPATGGISINQLKTVMNSVRVYNAPLRGLFLGCPAGTSDAVFDVLFGANVAVGSDHNTVFGFDVSRFVTFNLGPSTGFPTASSFVSLGGDQPAPGAPTNNPPFPSPQFPFPVGSTAPGIGWMGSVVSSSFNDHIGALPILPSGAAALTIHYLDIYGNAGFEVVSMTGRTPVDMMIGNKYQITDVEITIFGATHQAPFGQINIWSGTTDPVTGLPRGKVVGYLPPSYFTNFTIKQLTSWDISQLNPLAPGVPNYLITPDYGNPQTTVNDVTVPIPPGPSHSFLNWPPPAFMTNPVQPDNISHGQLAPAMPINSPLPPAQAPAYPYAPNFTNPAPFLFSPATGANVVPGPFNGYLVGAFAQAAGVDPRLVSQTITYA